MDWKRGPVHLDVAETLIVLGLHYRRVGEFEKSEMHFRRCKDIRTKIVGERHPLSAKIMTELADMLMEFKEVRESRRRQNHSQKQYTYLAVNALTLYSQALSIEEETYFKDFPGLESSLRKLCHCMIKVDMFQEARPLLERLARQLSYFSVAWSHQLIVCKGSTGRAASGQRPPQPGPDTARSGVGGEAGRL